MLEFDRLDTRIAGFMATYGIVALRWALGEGRPVRPAAQPATAVSAATKRSSSSGVV